MEWVKTRVGLVTNDPIRLGMTWRIELGDSDEGDGYTVYLERDSLQIYICQVHDLEEGKHVAEVLSKTLTVRASVSRRFVQEGLKRAKAFIL